MHGESKWKDNVKFSSAKPNRQLILIMCWRRSINIPSQFLNTTERDRKSIFSVRSRMETLTSCLAISFVEWCAFRLIKPNLWFVFRWKHQTALEFLFPNFQQMFSSFTATFTMFCFGMLLFLSSRMHFNLGHVRCSVMRKGMVRGLGHWLTCYRIYEPNIYWRFKTSYKETHYDATSTPIPNSSKKYFLLFKKKYLPINYDEKYIDSNVWVSVYLILLIKHTMMMLMGPNIKDIRDSWWKNEEH